MIKIKLNPDSGYTGRMFGALLRNDLHCPCQVPQRKSTLCICETFQLMIEDNNYLGECPCGLWIKSEASDEG